MREDIENRKVYAIYNEAYASPINSMWNGDLYIDCLENGFNEVLLYDFNDPTNPNLYSKYSWETITLDSTTYITTNDDITRQCHHLHNNGCYIEGIGYVNDGYPYSDLLFRFPALTTCPCNTRVQFMRYYDKNGTLVYSSPSTQYSYPYEPLVREDVRWEYIFRDTDLISGAITETPFWIEMKESVQFDNKDYNRCVAWSNENDTITLGYVRDDGATRQVLCRYEYNKDAEEIIYDFNNIYNATPIQRFNTTFGNVTKENLRYSYHNHDKYTIKDDNDNTLFHLIEGIGYVSDGPSYCNGYLLNYPYIPQPDSRDHQIIFRRLINVKDDKAIYNMPSGIRDITIGPKESFLLFNGSTITTNQEAHIEIFDLSGHKIASAHGLSLSTINLPSGIYIVRATTATTIETTKIIVK